MSKPVRTLLVTLALVLFAGSLAFARPVPFEMTRAELTARLEGPLHGTGLDRARKQQLRAVRDCIARIDRTDSDLVSLVATFRKLEACLRKPYAEEIVPDATPSQLGFVLRQELLALVDEVRHTRNDLVERLPRFAPDLVKAFRLIDAGDLALEQGAVSEDLRDASRLLAKAVKRYTAADRLLERALGSGITEGLTVTIVREEGVETWTATDLTVELRRVLDTLQIVASGPRAPEDPLEYRLMFTVQGAATGADLSIDIGAGELQIVDPMLPPEAQVLQRYVAEGTGSVRIAKLSTRRARVEGRFEFAAALDVQELVLAELQHGAFATSHAIVR